MRIRIKKQYLLLALIVLGVVSILGVLAWTLLNNQVDPNQAAAGGTCSVSHNDIGNTSILPNFDQLEDT
jgi:sensor domain CHASE-containing protein